MKTSHVLIGGGVVVAGIYLWRSGLAASAWSRTMALVGAGKATAPATSSDAMPVSSPTDYGEQVISDYAPTSSNGVWSGSVPSAGGGGGVTAQLPPQLRGSRYVTPVDARSAYAANINAAAPKPCCDGCAGGGGCAGSGNTKTVVDSPATPATRYAAMLARKAPAAR
jgi:hypothetical protein